MVEVEEVAGAPPQRKIITIIVISTLSLPDDPRCIYSKTCWVVRPPEAVKSCRIKVVEEVVEAAVLVEISAAAVAPAAPVTRAEGAAAAALEAAAAAVATH